MALDGRTDRQGNLEDMGNLVFTTAPEACRSLPASMQPPGKHGTFSVYRHLRARERVLNPQRLPYDTLRSFAHSSL